MHKRTVFSACCFFILLVTCQPLQAQGNKGKSVTNISFGSYVETHGDDQTTGSMLSIAYKRFFTDEWAWFARLGNGSASGTHELDNGDTTNIKSNRSHLSGGLQRHFHPESVTWLQPFVGGGISVQSYSYDYEYADSEIGSTSGIGYGPLFMVGARMDITRHFLIIPGYQFEQIYIESENGGSTTVTSSGFLLALVIRF